MKQGAREVEGEFSRESAARLVELLGGDDDAEGKLLAYFRLVEGWGVQWGLVSPSMRGEVLWRHVVESLAGALVRFPEAREAWVDVGSGAGLPGAVLAMVFPHTSFSLVEAARRRATFLEVVREKLGLANVEVLGVESEILARSDRRESWDVAIARAVAPAPQSLELCLPLVKVGGDVLIWLPPGVRVGALEAEGLGAGEYEVSWPLRDYGVRGGILRVRKERASRPLYPRRLPGRRRAPAARVDLEPIGKGDEQVP